MKCLISCVTCVPLCIVREATSCTKTCEYVFHMSRMSHVTGNKERVLFRFPQWKGETCKFFSPVTDVTPLLRGSRPAKVHEREDRSSLACVYMEAVRV
jgi:hypothetical protein